MSVLGTTALSHACGTQAAFTELSISETGFSKREVDIASPRRRLQIQVDGLSLALIGNASAHKIEAKTQSPEPGHFR
jgi:hypothetical protein